MSATPGGVIGKGKHYIRAWNGKLTEEMVLHPAHYGLGYVPLRLKPNGVTNSVCGYCSTGCSLKVHLRDGEAINLTPRKDYPVNLGMACPKGWEALGALTAEDRAVTPLLRDNAGRRRPVSWNQALAEFTSRFKEIQEKYGAASVAWLGTGQIVTEELAFLGALAKFGMGIIHGDGNTRQCMATSVAAYKQSFGFDAPPFTYADFEESDVIVLIGSNLCIAHPILWQRILANKRQPQIIVVDPRKTETASVATRHYQIRPKSDLVLFYGLARLLFEENALDHKFIENHTSGCAEFRAHVEGYTPDRVTAATGLSLSELRDFAQSLKPGKRVSIWWTMGVNQSHEGTRVAQAIINLALMTGNIGKPGTGANSITGQCNAMGSRLFSNTTNLLGGHDFLNGDHRQKIASLLQIDTNRIPAENSLAYDQILEGIDAGKIKGLWIIATNSAHSWLHQSRCRERLRKLEFLVVQDMYDSTETALEGDLLLPAAGWGEKDGTFINSERRFGVARKVRKAPGEALSDFRIFQLIAHAWGCADLFRDWTSPEAVFQILKKVSFGQPCDISGIGDYEAIDASGGIQWPCVKGAPVATERRLFEDGRFYHSDGRARFIFSEPRPPPDQSEYPFILLTGRGSSAQWHTLTRTGKSAVLKQLAPTEAYVEINPADAAKFGIITGAKVRITSAQGSVVMQAFITNTVSSGQVFIPMHSPLTNQLTFEAVDPYSRQPSYKFTRVALKAVAE
jgi:assimilatory nitrate reductase catalytic subunit